MALLLMIPTTIRSIAQRLVQLAVDSIDGQNKHGAAYSGDFVLGKMN